MQELSFSWAGTPESARAELDRRLRLRGQCPTCSGPYPAPNQWSFKVVEATGAFKPTALQFIPEE